MIVIIEIAVIIIVMSSCDVVAENVTAETLIGVGKINSKRRLLLIEWTPFYLISTICGNLNLPPLVQPRDLTLTGNGGVRDINICLISLVNPITTLPK